MKLGLDKESSLVVVTGRQQLATGGSGGVDESGPLAAPMVRIVAIGGGEIALIVAVGAGEIARIFAVGVGEIALGVAESGSDNKDHGNQGGLTHGCAAVMEWDKERGGELRKK